VPLPRDAARQFMSFTSPLKLFELMRAGVPPGARGEPGLMRVCRGSGGQRVRPVSREIVASGTAVGVSFALSATAGVGMDAARHGASSAPHAA
jgi:hypothetical protein